MDRYSILHGTNVAGGYKILGSAKAVASLLSKFGATDASSVATVVQNILGGFTSLPGYEKELMNTKPVAVRYAPMHLYKKKEMASLKPFCAMSISGAENRPGRITQYTQTWFFPRELMHTGGDFNYLDLLFGTHLTSWQEVEAFRQNQIRMDFSQLPEKVKPELKANDLRCVLRTVEAIYQGKNIVIRLENGLSFNQRAFELLQQIYSLIQPRLATEVGFATYQDPKTLSDLARENSIRIFVLPAEAPLDGLQNAGNLILDLQEPLTLEATPVALTLEKWTKLAWEVRQPALEKIFAKVDDFQNPDLYVQHSENFFAFLQRFEAWCADAGKNGSVATMEALYKEYETSVEGMQIPAVKQQFRNRIPALLKERGKLNELVSQSIFLALHGKNAEEKNRNLQYCQFALDIGIIDALPAVQETGKLVRNQADQEWTTKWDAEAQRRDTEKAELIQTHEHQTAELKQKLSDTVEKAKAAMAKQKADADAAMAKQKAESDDALAKQKAEADEAMTTQKAEAAAALVALKTQAEAALTKQKAQADEALAAQKAEAEATLATQKAASEAALATQKAEAETALATQKAQSEEALATQKQQSEATIAKLKEENADSLEKMKAAALTKIKEANALTKQAQDELAEEKSSHEKTRAELSATGEKLNAKTEELAAVQDTVEAAEKAKAKADKIIKADFKRMLVFAGAGFLAAALIFGLIMLIVGLVSGGEEAPETTIPTITTAPTTEPTTVPTTEPTTVPTTVPETEPEGPDFTVWTDGEAAGWLLAQVPEIAEIVYDNVDQFLVDMEPVEGYAPTAMLLTQVSQGEEYTLENFAVLLQRTEQEAADGEETESGEEPAETTPAEEPEATESTESTESEETAAAGDAENTPDPFANPTMVITCGDFMLVVYGNEDAMDMAMKAISNMVEPEEQVTIQWNLADGVKTAVVAAYALAEGQWWNMASTLPEEQEDVPAET